jgi:hypothetical protein
MSLEDGVLLVRTRGVVIHTVKITKARVDNTINEDILIDKKA